MCNISGFRVRAEEARPRMTLGYDLLTITGAKLEPSRFEGWLQVRFARAFRWSMMVAALAAAVPGALAQGRNDLDYMTYGQPTYVAPQPAPDGGGAIAALRRAFSRPAYVAPAPAYAPPLITKG